MGNIEGRRKRISSVVCAGRNALAYDVKDALFHHDSNADMNSTGGASIDEEDQAMKAACLSLAKMSTTTSVSSIPPMMLAGKARSLHSDRIGAFSLFVFARLEM